MNRRRLRPFKSHAAAQHNGQGDGCATRCVTLPTTHPRVFFLPQKRLGQHRSVNTYNAGDDSRECQSKPIPVLQKPASCPARCTLRLPYWNMRHTANISSEVHLPAVWPSIDTLAPGRAVTQDGRSEPETRPILVIKEPGGSLIRCPRKPRLWNKDMSTKNHA